ncbi:hypothetical protein FIBSPDRAFT_914755 [Athelia psychrophila]|uniref:Uncharacterized protein n=1 Tax=Athelia psychrophila TaxID=1759441 RepID=A0A167WHS1_9AGAM|nr:hypothetical protein FIBSPDRAFT_914755 [Fibularhizoctonia sp. CBS 109695]
MLWTYVDHQSPTYGQWQATSLRTSRALGYTVYRGRKLHTDETLAQEIHLHLQSIGPYCKAMDIVDFLDTPEMRARTGFNKQIGLVTAQEWMKKLEYRWTLTPTGQYVDGHERPDVWHDESQFYANDRRQRRWVHKLETAVPRPKGQGASQMVADMASADYGFLRSPDGKHEARVLFKAGKNRNGYFTNTDILAQAHKAMDILEQFYPDEDHVLVFDNATTHHKHADGALSARHMPKKPLTSLETNWLVRVKVRDENGCEVVKPNGKLVTTEVLMEDGWFADGSRQSLYFEPGHPQAGLFKGMSMILQERGLVKESQLHVECKNFKCPQDATSCCCRCALYTQADFVNVKSLLEIECEARGFTVIFLPKFHYELNFIEQVWGYTKRIYRQYPGSSREADLERNLIMALDSVPLESMRKFSTRSCRFMDAYEKGANGKLAAWADKKFAGHCVIPPKGLMAEFDDN